VSHSPDVFGLQDEDLAQGRLQGEQVGPGGLQQVSKHPTDHVLNHVKALNPVTKLVFNSYSNFVGLTVCTSGQGNQEAIFVVDSIESSRSDRVELIRSGRSNWVDPIGSIQSSKFNRKWLPG